MPHSQHGKDTTAKQKSRRSISHYSKGKQDKPKQRAIDVFKSQPITAAASTNVQPPAEKSRPWSPWIPGDDGRWFYQGRLKADGGWEYQFTEGYPPTSRRRDPSLYTTFYGTNTQPLPYDSAAAVPTVSDAPAAQPQHSEPVNEEEVTEQGDEDGQEDDTETYTQAPPQVHDIMVPQVSQAVILADSGRPPAATKSGSGSQALVKHSGGKGGKKLSAIIKADKERRINSRKRVKSWLSEVTP
ncbi:hypothetical protein BR93DRAFT_486646 [Coniochaeta sp. PMI_546]|nr:hypothetical protein BR93DRAFT_486646 [Coniochaeta sp. PMI_546]